MSVFILSVQAHETNKAYFNIVQKNAIVDIEIEFPWTIRNALLAFNPQLEKSTNKKDFEKSFFEYLEANLILKNKKREPLKMLSVQEMKHNGHSHQSNYLITFQGSEVEHVTNTIMFDISEKQINNHSLYIRSKNLKFTTTNNSPDFNLTLPQKNKLTHWWWLILTLPLFLSVKWILEIKKKEKVQSSLSQLIFDQA